MAWPERPHIGIIIPTADPAKYPASRALEIVRQTTAHLDVDVQIVRSSGAEFRIARSINRGIDATKDADAWVLLNDDAFMDAGWLDAMIAAARAHPEVGIWGAVLRFEDGRIQHAGGRIPLTPLEYLAIAAAPRHRAPFWALRRIREHGWREHAYMFDHYPRYEPRHRLDFITGACALITKDCHARIGGYDEEYVFGAEDTDHSLRALEAGLEIGLVRGCTGIHLEGASGRPVGDRQAQSIATFHAHWPAERIRKATRARRGVHHG